MEPRLWIAALLGRGGEAALLRTPSHLSTSKNKTTCTVFPSSSDICFKEWNYPMRVTPWIKIEGKLATTWITLPLLIYCTASYNQGCKWNDRSLNRGLNRGRGRGIDETFFWDSCSNLEIDENFRISHELGLGLAKKFSKAFAIQLDRYRGQ